MVLLAEQIVIDCPPRALEDLLGHRPIDWVTPLLRLAGDEGEAAGLAVLGERPDSPAARQHGIELGSPTFEAGVFRSGILWRTAGYRLLFGEFQGTIEVRPLENHSVMAIQGHASGPPAGAGRRAAEGAVRSLLGHLRAAVEAQLHAVGHTAGLDS